MASTYESCRDEVDLTAAIYEATGQIPKGMVSTYGDIARALGDVRAARAVGTVLANNPRPIVVPCHRVIFSDGRVGWYGGSGKGNQRKVDLLLAEGLRIDEGLVQDLSSVLFKDFRLTPVLKDLSQSQSRMRELVIEKDDFGSLDRVAGLDVAYSGSMGFAAMVVMDAESEEVLEQKVMSCQTKFPYIPGYLGFRETPLMARLVKEKRDIVYLVDGHGTLHPRGFGVACQIGVELNIPTVGAAKSLLEGSVVHGRPGKLDAVEMEGKVRGYALGKGEKKTTFVSVGHRVSLPTSAEICQRYMHHSVPEPLRLAHLLAASERRKYQDNARD